MKRDLLVSKALSNSLDFWIKCQALGLSDLDMVAVIDAGTHVDVLTHVLQRKASSNLTYNEHYTIAGVNDVVAGYNLLSFRNYLLQQIDPSGKPITEEGFTKQGLDYCKWYDTVDYYIYGGSVEISPEILKKGWHIAVVSYHATRLFNDTYASFECAARMIIEKQHCHPSTHAYWAATHEDIILHR